MRLAVRAPSALELAAAVRAGRATPRDLVAAALARLDEVDGELGAFVAVDRDRALREAADPPDGPLRGVPVAVKDLYDVAGEATRAGSALPPGPPAGHDAVAVARLRAAGAVVVGRTRTHEWAWGITTQHTALGGARDAWDTDRVPGGSSGGSAAAVAAGVVPLALGTDTGASVRLPAAWCGLVGHKPTHGAVPLDGCVPLAPSLDTGGALVRTVADARLALEVLGGRALPPPAPVHGLRLGVVPGHAVVEALAATARAEGLARLDVALPLADRVVEAYAAVQGVEALAWHRGTGRWPAQAAAYGPDVRGHLERCERRDPAAVEQGQRWRAELRAGLAALFERVELLLLPVAVSGPSRVADPDRAPDGSGALRAAVLPWTVPANLAGLPACAVPAGLDADGLPVGVQVVGPPGSDARVLDVAERLAQPLPW